MRVYPIANSFSVLGVGVVWNPVACPLLHTSPPTEPDRMLSKLRLEYRHTAIARQPLESPPGALPVLV